MPERLDNIKFLGKGKLEVNIGGRKVLIEETSAPRKVEDHGKQKVEKGSEYPEGTLESLRPLLRGVFAGAFDDEAYWAEIDAQASMTPNEAANKLKKAKKGYNVVARELVLTDPTGHENIVWQSLGEQEIEAKISEVARVILPFFRSRVPKSK